MKIAAFSDTHGCTKLPDIEKDTDVVCIAGDIVHIDVQRNKMGTDCWMKDVFMEWARNCPAKRIIFIAGNHDFYITDKGEVPYISTMIKNTGLEEKVIFLEDSSYEYEGIKFFGTPWVTGLPLWAFNTRDPKLTYSVIEDCDILISHHAPKIGKAGTSHFYSRDVDFGSPELADVLRNRNIRYNICGHIHTGNHEGEVIEREDGSKCLIYNVSMINEQYNPAFLVKYFEIERL